MHVKAMAKLIEEEDADYNCLLREIIVSQSLAQNEDHLLEHQRFGQLFEKTFPLQTDQRAFAQIS